MLKLFSESVCVWARSVENLRKKRTFLRTVRYCEEFAVKSATAVPV